MINREQIFGAPSLKLLRGDVRGYFKLMRLGAASVAFVFLFQVMGLCLCISRAPSPTNLHACCPQPVSERGASSAPSPMASLADHARECSCAGALDALSDLRLNDREPLHAPVPCPVAAGAGFSKLADQDAAFCGSASARTRASSPLKSSILRI